MKNLQLVNQHWSAWATGAHQDVEDSEMYVPSRDIVKVLAERFFNVEEVQLDRVSFLTDNGLHAVRRWPNLTHLDASGLTC